MQVDINAIKVILILSHTCDALKMWTSHAHKNVLVVIGSGLRPNNARAMGTGTAMF